MNTNRVDNGPWLSVVIPIYNAEAYLDECLRSIATQTFRDFEVLLIDDGSTDRSAEICRDYAAKDSRFRHLRKENGGCYQARIFGSERTNGTYITFCDADDYYTCENAFQILYHYLSSGKYAAAQFSHVKKYNHLKQKKICVTEPVSVNQKEFIANEYPLLLCSKWDSRITPNVWNKIYHRKLLANFPASSTEGKVFWGEDFIVNLHLLSTCDTMLFIPEILYSYRMISGGTNKFSLRMIEDMDNIKRYQMHYLETYTGDAVEQIKTNLFAESAAWFYHYIQQSLKHLSEPEVEAMIQRSLQLPCLIQARDYYLNESDTSWEAVDLLRKADVKEYIAKAKVFRDEHPHKAAIRRFLAKIYASI